MTNNLGTAIKTYLTSFHQSLYNACQSDNTCNQLLNQGFALIDKASSYLCNGQLGLEPAQALNNETIKYIEAVNAAKDSKYTTNKLLLDVGIVTNQIRDFLVNLRPPSQTAAPSKASVEQKAPSAPVTSGFNPFSQQPSSSFQMQPSTFAPSFQQQPSTFAPSFQQQPSTFAPSFQPQPSQQQPTPQQQPLFRIRALGTRSPTRTQAGPQQQSFQLPQAVSSSSQPQQQPQYAAMELSTDFFITI